MHLLVTFKTLDTYDSSIGPLSCGSTVGSMLEKALGPDGVVAGGCFADLPGGFFMVDVESPEQLAGILGEDLLDDCQVEINRVTAREKVAADLEQWYKAQQTSPALERGA